MSKALKIGILAIVTFAVSVFAITAFYFSEITLFQQFVTGFAAGLLGILLGFLLDRAIEYDKDNELKENFLSLLQEELKEIKNSIYPQTGHIYLLYTEIWDSVISSGVIRLLSSEQVAKLSGVFKSIKGTSYEAEWVRRGYEERDSLPPETPNYIYVSKKCEELKVSHKNRMEKLDKQIHEVLEEEWWN